MFHWNEETVGLMRDACEYGGSYHKRLAEIALQYLPRGRLCDAGCGLGYLSLALAPFCRSVTACDVSAAALSVLRSEAEARRLQNIRILCGDIMNSRPERRYDGMVFCLFGSFEECMRMSRAQGTGPVVLFMRADRTHRFSIRPAPLRTEPPETACRRLAVWGVPVRRESLALEFGQPFRSLESAVRFFTQYRRDGGEITEEAVSARLVKTGDAVFPLYLPEKKRLECLCLDTRRIPENAWKEML
ncbi:MAG: class I SAM-dependent methyltransferase [Oscillospiraceae bacterium]|nr:class I SAM-dependent methyltransferase [Oscillospiraceae bacterium]